MPTYHFKRNVKVYVVDELDNRYNIDISDINFSQTFVEKSVEAKTIQESFMFEDAVITKANPANFSITIPALREDDLKVVFDRLLDYQSFDLYVDTGDEVFKLEKCVITSGTFLIEKTRPLGMGISGEASKLTNPGVLSGTPITRDSNRTYNRVTRVAMSVDSVSLTNINTISIQLTNNIKWSPYETLQGICEVIETQEPLYPIDYVIESRELSGVTTCYLTEDNVADLQTYALHQPIYIGVGEDVSGTIYGFELDMNDCYFSALLNPAEVYRQVYSWRLTENPTALSDLVSYITL